MRRILLKSSDDETFEVQPSIANHSKVVAKLLEDLDEPSSSSSDSITVPLPNVKGAALSMVIEWISKHEDEQMQMRGEELRNWEAEFVNVDLQFVYELILAADYLEVNAMFHRFCQKVADVIAGKTPEEIRSTFNIENDHSPEEEAELRRQNAWTFEPADATTSTPQ